MNNQSPVTIQRPSLGLLCSEPFRAVTAFASHKFRKADKAKPGDGHAVVIFPGLGTDWRSVVNLRRRCRALGYDAFDWGQGFNTGPRGDFDAWLDNLKSRVVDPHSRHTQPATLIGWRLGGLYAHEIGKLMAPRIRQVITMGTPFNAEADHTNAVWLFFLLSDSSSTVDPAMTLRLRTPPPMRTTSIYSRSSGVVAWQTCRHHKRSRLVHDIEVGGSHVGMSWTGMY